MTRSLTLALLLALHGHAAVPIAPLPPVITAMDAIEGTTATNGHATLFAWTYRISPYPGMDSVYARLATSTHEGEAFFVGHGNTPHIATNGDDYLIGYAAPRDKTSTMLDSIHVRLVRADGRLLEPVQVHSSPGVTAMAWSGAHWLVAYNHPSPAIAVLDADLRRVRTIDIAGAIRQFVVVGHSVFAIRSGAGTEAIEIRADSTGVIHNIDRPDGRIVVTGAHTASAFFNTGNGIEIASFDAATGFGPLSPLMSERTFDGATASDAGVLLLHDDPASNAFAVSEIVDAQVRSTSTVITDAGQFHEASLSSTMDGPVLLLNSSLFRGLRSYALDPPRTVSVAEGTLVSRRNIARQEAPLIASNGTNLVVFWRQTIDADGRMALFSRMLDRDAHPIGEATQLMDDATPESVAFDGTRFVLAWAADRVYAMIVSADGRSASERIELGYGSDDAKPRVASGAQGTFVIWNEIGQVRGTPLRADGAPVVPGGFLILPTLSGKQEHAAITALFDDFVIVWNDRGIQSIVISPMGTVKSASRMTDRDADAMTLASWGQSALGTWRDVETGRIGLISFSRPTWPPNVGDPQWGEFAPQQVVPLSQDYYRVVMRRGAMLYTSDIPMPRGSIGRIDRPAPFGALGIAAMAAIDTKPVVAHQEGPRILISRTAASRARAVRH